MKTTGERAKSLLQPAAEPANQKGGSMRDLAEQGSDRVIKGRVGRGAPEMNPVTYQGKGLSPEFRKVGWSGIREAAYEGRGA